MNEQIGAEMQTIPEKRGRVNAVAFDSAELRASPIMGQGLYLVVRGPAPDNGAQVKLLPALGEHMPDYRQIEIVSEERVVGEPMIDGDLSGLIKAQRYEKSMPLSEFVGNKGIELIGANKSKKFNLTE